MKTKNIFYTFALVIAMCSCSNQSSNIEYLPCKENTGDDWGFVNAKGEVFCKDAFKHTPSPVVEGIFYVQEGDSYSLYKFDKKKPVLMMEDLVHVGKPENGIFPICRKDGRIEIINLKGNTLFTLENIDGQEVVSCDPYFKFGYLKVRSIDVDGTYNYSLINEKGKEVLKPKYQDIKIISNKLFYVSICEDGETTDMFIDTEGKKQSHWKDIDVYCITDKYIGAVRDERSYIYDLKGKEILKCSDKVETIIQIEGSTFVYEGENGYGVMDFRGERIVSDKYGFIQIINDGRFLVKKDYNHDYELLDKKGEQIEKISDYDEIDFIKDFGYIGIDNNTGYILNDKLKPASKVELKDIENPSYYRVESDFFDYGSISMVVKNALENGLNEKGIKLGASVSSISAVTSKGTNEYNRYTESATIVLAKSNKYSVNARLYFDDNILEPIYTEKVVRERGWYSYYTTTKRVIDGYRFNSEAMVTSIEIECNVPSDKKDMMHKELTNVLKGFSKENQDEIYIKDGLEYTLSGTTIIIDDEIGISEVAVNEEVEVGW